MSPRPTACPCIVSPECRCGSATSLQRSTSWESVYRRIADLNSLHVGITEACVSVRLIRKRADIETLQIPDLPWDNTRISGRHEGGQAVKPNPAVPPHHKTQRTTTGKGGWDQRNPAGVVQRNTTPLYSPFMPRPGNGPHSPAALLQAHHPSLHPPLAAHTPLHRTPLVPRARRRSDTARR